MYQIMKMNLFRWSWIRICGKEIKNCRKRKNGLQKIHSRIQELDKIFQRIYEDNISGKLSDERFMKLSKGYEEEQHTLQEEQTSLEKELQKEEKQSVDVKQFLSVVRKYTNLTELNTRNCT